MQQEADEIAHTDDCLNVTNDINYINEHNNASQSLISIKMFMHRSVLRLVFDIIYIPRNRLP